MARSYTVSYDGCPELGSQLLCQGLSIEDAFAIVAQESADAFFSYGGNGFRCTDLNYTVRRPMQVLAKDLGWIQTFTGKAFYPLEPRSCIEKICIEDIAWALSMQCRYSGHTKKFYSVAEHCVLISQSLGYRDALAGLLHDASEAYLVDIPKPLKPFLPEYAVWETNLMEAIASVFDFQYPLPESIKEADTRILHDEKLALMGDSEKDWNLPLKPLGVEIQAWNQQKAFEEFMERFSLYQKLKKLKS